jgi:hypothetical protein
MSSLPFSTTNILSMTGNRLVKAPSVVEIQNYISTAQHFMAYFVDKALNNQGVTSTRSGYHTACHINQGIARTQSPTNKNYAFELPTFGVIVGVNPTVVQWPGLTLEEPPS